MEELNRKDMVPVVGLLHHGSGPRQTDLLDPDFPGKLAAYALQVAERYPSVVQYTPVNEPNTTSRFACLYGHWYPHHRSMESYIRALVNQIKATVLSMQAIRTVQPLAELVYTEDGGGIFSTPAMEVVPHCARASSLAGNRPAVRSGHSRASSFPVAVEERVLSRRDPLVFGEHLPARRYRAELLPHQRSLLG